MTASSSLLLLCLALPVAMAAAAQFRVGGSTVGWTVPSDPGAMSYNQWAERNRFKIGDSLLFVYQPGSDSVLQVRQDDYSACRTSSPIQSYSDGNTVVTLDHSGPFYFISGVEKRCLRNESMVVVVLADRTPSSGASQPPTMPPPPPPPPSPSPPSPSTGASPPPPPPSSEVAPSQPPTGGKGSPTKNGAPLKAMGLMGTVGALLGPLLVL